MIKNENGCPCAKDCCDYSNTYTPIHTCPEDAWCDECFREECKVCGAACYCNI